MLFKDLLSLWLTREGLSPILAVDHLPYGEAQIYRMVRGAYLPAIPKAEPLARAMGLPARSLRALIMAQRQLNNGDLDEDDFHQLTDKIVDRLKHLILNPDQEAETE